MTFSAVHRVDRQVGGRQRGGVLLEVLLAVALFAGAAGFTLGCVKSVFTALDRTRREQEAVDIARSKMAELQAGLIPLTELRGQPVDALGTVGPVDLSTSASGLLGRWMIEVRTERSEFTGLTLVELSVRERAENEDAAFIYTLRQLVPLRNVPGESLAVHGENDSDPASFPRSDLP